MDNCHDDAPPVGKYQRGGEEATSGSGSRRSPYRDSALEAVLKAEAMGSKHHPLRLLVGTGDWSLGRKRYVSRGEKALADAATIRIMIVRAIFMNRIGIIRK
ncbi:MAG: hypothetical protein GY904_17045 [Planctomycetaceae bacterium]|nr:hypothetical protein [Planctomycetaceae bacterium]